MFSVTLNKTFGVVAPATASAGAVRKPTEMAHHVRKKATKGHTHNRPKKSEGERRLKPCSYPALPAAPPAFKVVSK